MVTDSLAGGAAGAPFDIDVGAGHAVFRLVVALSVGLAALWLVRNGATELAFRFALSSASAALPPRSVGGSIGGKTLIIVRFVHVVDTPRRYRPLHDCTATLSSAWPAI